MREAVTGPGVLGVSLVPVSMRWPGFRSRAVARRLVRGRFHPLGSDQRRALSMPGRSILVGLSSKPKANLKVHRGGQAGFRPIPTTVVVVIPRPGQNVTLESSWSCIGATGKPLPISSIRRRSMALCSADALTETAHRGELSPAVCGVPSAGVNPHHTVRRQRHSWGAADDTDGVGQRAVVSHRLALCAERVKCCRAEPGGEIVGDAGQPRRVGSGEWGCVGAGGESAVEDRCRLRKSALLQCLDEAA